MGSEILRINVNDRYYYIKEGEKIRFHKRDDGCFVDKGSIFNQVNLDSMEEFNSDTIPLVIESLDNCFQLKIKNRNKLKTETYNLVPSSKYNNAYKYPDTTKRISLIRGSEEIHSDIIYFSTAKDENQSENYEKIDEVNAYTDMSKFDTDSEDLSDTKRIKNIIAKNDKTTRLDSGSSRVVFAANGTDIGFIDNNEKCVIKIAYNSMKYENMQEIQTWQSVKNTEIGKYFCPITNIGPNHEYIVMKKAYVLNDDKNEYTEKDYKKAANTILSVFKEHSEESFYRDIYPYNVGFMDDRDNPVIVDYTWGGVNINK